MSFYLGSNAIAGDDMKSDGTNLNYGNELPSNGLLLNLSAYNYTGAGPWHDSQQNIPMQAINGSMTKTTAAGVPCLAFDGTNYWESSAADGNKVDMTGEFTLVLVTYANTPSARRTIFEKVPNTYASYEQELACTWETDNNISFYTQVSSYDNGNMGVQTNAAWNLRAIKMRGDRTQAYSWLGGAWSGNVLTNRSDGMVVRAGGVRVGHGYAGTCFTGYLFSVLVYGVALNTTEMTKVHNYYSRIMNRYGATLYN